MQRVYQYQHKEWSDYLARVWFRFGRMGALTDVAPDWCNVADIITPNNGVYELNQASGGSPDHECASPRVPRLEVPW